MFEYATQTHDGEDAKGPSKTRRSASVSMSTLMWASTGLSLPPVVCGRIRNTWTCGTLQVLSACVSGNAWPNECA